MGKRGFYNFGSPKNLAPLVDRIAAIKHVLISSYEAGKGLPNQVIGNEREIFVKNYLNSAYPKPFRFSTGCIMDQAGNVSGQLDIIAEKMHSISFPVQPDSVERLCLAEFVTAVISVKSNLSAQWKEVVRELNKLDLLEAKESGTFIVNADNGKMNYFVVSYSGGLSVENLRGKLSSMGEDSSLQALVVLDSGLCAFKTCSNNKTDWYVAQSESAFLYFVCELHNTISKTFSVGSNMWDYACDFSDYEK